VGSLSQGSLNLKGDGIMAITRVLPTTEEELAFKNELQKSELRDFLNRNGTREEFMISPEEETDYLRIMHYIHCGRAKEIGDMFDEIHSELNVFGADQVIGGDALELPALQREAILLAVWEFWRDLFRQYPEACRHLAGL
jgi:hypothetical protein